MRVSRLGRRLKVDFAQVLSGNVLYFACQWLIVVALAKLGTPEQVGEYALGMAICAPILLFANLQLRALIASDVHDQFSLRQYFAFRLLSLVIALLVIAGIAVVAGSTPPKAAIIMVVCLAQSLDYIAETYYGWMQKYARLDRMARSQAIKGPLALTALCVVMYLTHSVLWAVLGLTAARLAVLLAWDARLGYTGGSSLRFDRDFFRLDGNPRFLGPLLKLSFPLGVISMTGGLSASIPRYFVEAFRGSAELGIFSAIASLLSTGTLVVSAFGQSVFLPVAEACARLDQSAFRTYVAAAAAVGAMLGGAGVLVAATFGRQILAHLFRPEYGLRQDVFVQLMIAGSASFAACAAGYVVTAARSITPQVPVLAAAALAAVVVCARLVPKYGLNGAADAVLVAALVQLAGTAVIVWRVDRQLQSLRLAATELGGGRSAVEAGIL
ncbi:MAG TPA: oligosaccharide flippase family protein [Bryobacteraceae bacterium]|nr:oligosaccharide flippase family protein [Bryobacteraceae bacterium]